ncbi:hypothetical protein QQ008_04010 [Fulvivirgaceae bacterium BMA10]|uniref:Uncharacterized protein n=1 Tax=Splendidivirga corallicola TaxID=3051826 RepID=A0ABT8KLR6_9BACT|nr:hypothetical protein [Fulvivirgaceae bacterium BMA10]
MEYSDGHVLTSSQIVVSKKFWDKLMVEPETLAYTKAHFESQDKTATKMRHLIFEKHSKREKPWIICDTCLELFDVDKEQTKQHASEWWSSEGSFTPPSCGKADENMEDDQFKEAKSYAVMEAGQRLLR